MDTDPNEIHAFLRVCQDEELLQALDQRCARQIDRLQAGEQNLLPEQGFLQTTQHGAGALQVPMTGPAAPLERNTTVEQQARVNRGLVDDITDEGRRVPAAPPATEVDIGGDGEGFEEVAAAEEEEDGGTRESRPKVRSTRRRKPAD